MADEPKKPGAPVPPAPPDARTTQQSRRTGTPVSTGIVLGKMVTKPRVIEPEGGHPPTEPPPKTPRMGLSGFAAFYDAAREIVERLASEQTPLGNLFRSRALRLADTFARWATSPPDVAERSKTIQALVELNVETRAYEDGERQARELLARTGNLPPHVRAASPVARRLVSDIIAVADDFALWKGERPPEANVREQTIQALSTLTDQVNALLRGER